MSWAIFAICALIAMVFEVGLVDTVHILHIKPSMCAVLATFIALSAPRVTALWACMALGLLLDLSTDLSVGFSRTLHLIGPYTLGYVFACFIVLQMRSTVFRRRALTIGTMTLLFAFSAMVITVTLYIIRSWYPEGPLYWAEVSTFNEIMRRFFSAIYSGVMGVPIGWVLARSTPLWQFHTTPIRGGGVAWR